ncbi:MAG: histidine kinase [Reichenbachiella sp.]|uniref:sensor histidine kinase n=1 Tax=Reichenbachiella sp. TaxID=2184521 RepID=UPI003264E3AB
MKITSADIEDRVIRIIGPQFFGIVIPNATGLISNQDRSVIFLMLSYLYFIGLASMIWEGNRFLLFKLQDKFSWFIHPAQKALTLLAANILYTTPLVMSVLILWYTMVRLPIDWKVVQITAAVCVVCVIFITHVYETVFLIKQREGDMVENERLERAKVQAELEALKNQIDPHFMFNSLNNLSQLIDLDSKKAKVFTENLAEVYRYILGYKDQELVLLNDEIDFMNQYTSLLQLRFGKALLVKNTFESNQPNSYLIPPLSVFMAIENVVKHNEITRKKPLTVKLSIEEDYLQIANHLIPKSEKTHSSKIGLKNLEERFLLIADKKIEVTQSDNQFRLALPLLKLNA